MGHLCCAFLPRALLTASPLLLVWLCFAPRRFILALSQPSSTYLPGTLRSPSCGPVLQLWATRPGDPPVQGLRACICPAQPAPDLEIKQGHGKCDNQKALQVKNGPTPDGQ